MRSPEPNREVFRLAPPLIFWWVWVAFAVANVADFAIEGAPARFAIVVTAILVTITGLAYALALRPRVIAEPSGLTIVNPFRDHHVRWAAITAVDTGDWVRVHYAAGQPGPATSPSSAASKAVSCWALYLSTRTKRRAARAARPAPRPRAGLLRPFPVSSPFAAPGPEPGYAETSRLPEEAKYLASLPVAKAIAVRLDTRADRERARRGQASTGQASTGQASTGQASTGQASTGQASTGHPVTARWAWPPVVAVALPALALIVIAVVF